MISTKVITKNLFFNVVATGESEAPVRNATIIAMLAIVFGGTWLGVQLIGGVAKKLIN
jgi:hypothetical protein